MTQDTVPLIKTLPDAISFLKLFHRRLPASDTLDAARIPEQLPPPLAMVYRELGGWLSDDHDILTPLGAHNFLIGPEDLKWKDGMVEFAAENQQIWTCRCQVSSLDPAVYSDAPEYWAAPREGFIEINRSLCDFLITFCLTEALFACHHIETLDEHRPSFGGDLIPVWLNGRHVYENKINFYIVKGSEILVMEADKTHLGSPT